MHLLRYSADKRALRAFHERQEAVKSGFTRRDLMKMGAMTSTGFLLSDKGLPRELITSRALAAASPPLRAFVEPLPILPVLPKRSPAEFDPAPTNQPNRAINPVTGLPFEGRSEVHQSRDRFPAQDFFITRVAANNNVRPSPDLPPQTFWGFNLGGENLNADPAISPGPTIVTRYDSPALVRRINQLPPPEQNGGFGVPEITTHLHNFHSASDSDGGPCNPVQQRFFFRGQYYDYFYNMKRAGWDSGFAPDGDVRETLSGLWYHDHRVDHTAENVYKGLAGFHLMFDENDTGDESTGLHLPSFPEFDVPMIFTDKQFAPDTGLLAFDAFNLDGILGDRFLVNGKNQPFFEVQRRRYRFRWLDGGPSRFYEFFLTNPDNLSQSIPFWVIAPDGNLLGRPVETTSARIGVAERVEVIVDFAKIAARFGNPSRIILENRLEQVNGRGPTENVLPAGQGDRLVEFRLVGGAVSDGSFDPEPVAFPNVPASPNDAVFAPIGPVPRPSEFPVRITRTFRFERGNGQWQINGQLMDCTIFRFTAQRNTNERWILQNNSGDWEHPIHIHHDEHLVISRNGVPINFSPTRGVVESGRKDVTQLRHGEQIEVITRHRDFRGGYPLHCHNTVHEDHKMLLLWDIQDQGDNNTRP
jgi:FtsP/CotA-like multicopper oxidase with cupredoxin domain